VARGSNSRVEQDYIPYEKQWQTIRNAHDSLGSKAGPPTGWEAIVKETKKSA
jgi:hypothetical protein